MISAISNFKEQSSAVSLVNQVVSFNSIVRSDQLADKFTSSKQVVFTGNLAKLGKPFVDGDLGGLGRKARRFVAEITEFAQIFFRKLKGQDEILIADRSLPSFGTSMETLDHIPASMREAFSESINPSMVADTVTGNVSVADSIIGVGDVPDATVSSVMPSFGTSMESIDHTPASMREALSESIHPSIVADGVAAKVDAINIISSKVDIVDFLLAKADAVDVVAVKVDALDTVVTVAEHHSWVSDVIDGLSHIF